MNQYSTYDSATGAITGHLQPGTTPLDVVRLVHPNIVQGYWPADQYHIVDGLPTLLTPTVDLDTLSMIQRQHRNTLLATVDRINPVWYAALTTQQQTELAVYRQALLDVPQQVSWPESVSWPQQPTWL